MKSDEIEFLQHQWTKAQAERLLSVDPIVDLKIQTRR